MLTTRDHLNTVEVWVEPIDQAEWRKVIAPTGEKFLLVASDVTDEILEDMTATDPFLAMMLAVGIYPRKDSVVFRADEDWNIVGECNEECSQGVCTRRVAESASGKMDDSYGLLLAYLNS